jgi:hypothetical protein
MTAMSSPNQHLLLVAGPGGLDGADLPAVRAFATDPDARVQLVVVPAPRGADPDDLERRLHEGLDALADLGLEADGHVGVADPVLAVDDALVHFPATELRVATDGAADVAFVVMALNGLPAVDVSRAALAVA